MSNAHVIVVTLPKSDRFHTRDDLHLAKIAQDRIEDALSGAFTNSDQCVVRIAGKQQPQG
jgi:hypothetical protein